MHFQEDSDEQTGDKAQTIDETFYCNDSNTTRLLVRFRKNNTENDKKKLSNTTVTCNSPLIKVSINTYELSAMREIDLDLKRREAILFSRFDVVVFNKYR